MSNRPFTQPWTRREVLEDLLVPAAAGIALAGLAGCGGGRELSADKRVGAPALDLVVVRNGEPDVLVREALAALGGMQRFIARGDRVVLKPNIGFNRVPEQAANTNPDVVRALAVEILNAGPRRSKSSITASMKLVIATLAAASPRPSRTWEWSWSLSMNANSWR